ncbi:hypothetical protein C349_06637 [Cryptococcus neoformans var. grubii Br795]|nr:hypothetical protein C349_06637 [Cryptococcus neoformans var. grubii Br795]
MAAESSWYERQWWVERWCGRETEEFGSFAQGRREAGLETVYNEMAKPTTFITPLLLSLAIRWAVEMLKMEIIPISTARMDNLYSGQITSQHVLADPGWDAPISELVFSKALRTLSHTDLLPVLPQSSSHKPPLHTISGSENAKNPPGRPS